MPRPLSSRPPWTAGGKPQAWRPATRSYDWSARHPEGRLMRGRSRAGGVHQVRAQLRREGLTPLSVEPTPWVRRRGIRGRDRVLFTRQLATLLEAGIPLLQGLHILRQGLGHPAMAELMDDLARDLERGLSLASAMRRHPQVFPALEVHMVEAGEASGQLGVLLQRLATDQEKMLALQSRVRSALAYPAVVLSVAVLVVVLVMVAVVPSFESVFASFGAQLPAATQLVIGLSRALVTHGPWLLVLGVLVAGVGLRHWRQSEVWRRRTEAWTLALPVLGPVLHQAALARWSRTLAGLLSAGLPLVEAMGAARGAAGFYLYADACARFREELARGSSLHLALGATRLFPPMAVQMCAVGEESGTLAAMLTKVAEAQERQVDEQVAVLSTLLEPFIIVVLGVLIGALVISLYLPIFQMGQIT